jgi:hypothetical protein
MYQLLKLIHIEVRSVGALPIARHCHAPHRHRVDGDQASGVNGADRAKPVGARLAGDRMDMRRIQAGNRAAVE